MIWGFGVKAVTPDAVYIQPDPAGRVALDRKTLMVIGSLNLS